MASINICIDDALKARAYRELERLGVNPYEFVREVLQYVAEQGKLPVWSVSMAEGDEDLIAIVRERLALPQREQVHLDDL